MVELGGVSRPSFYSFEEDPPKVDRDMDLRNAIRRVALKGPSYGRPRITAELKRQGWKVGPNRVRLIMREDNLLCVRKRTLRANIDETVLPVIMTEQGENGNQCEEQRNLLGFSHGFACCGT